MLYISSFRRAREELTNNRLFQAIMNFQRDVLNSLEMNRILFTLECMNHNQMHVTYIYNYHNQSFRFDSDVAKISRFIAPMGAHYIMYAESNET